MAGILLLTVGVVSVLNAWLASARVERQLEAQLLNVATTLSSANFPLESTVLRQTRGLTGAEYVVTDSAGKPVAASDEALMPLAARQAPGTRGFDLSRVAVSGERTYFHAVAPLDRRPVGGSLVMLHVLYPEAAWREARWQAVWPPLAIGLVAVLLVASAAVAVALHVTRPMQQLRAQVERIAGGNFEPVPAPPRDDELRDLALSVNQMAARLARYEAETRKNERLQTLATLGGGIAHQIRNAATGCRIALDLHERDCPLARSNGRSNGHADEPLHVAARQLEQIETHVQRFLTLGRPSAAERKPVSIPDLVSDAVGLVEPMATHVGVRLVVSHAEPDEARVCGDRQALGQMLVNLLVNAIEAAAKTRVAAATPPATADEAAVAIQTEYSAADCSIMVVDPGPGPADAIQSRLFEPFATDKPGGTGLGLVVSRQIAEDHGGSIRWERRDDRTRFMVTLPRN